MSRKPDSVILAAQKLRRTCGAMPAYVPEPALGASRSGGGALAILVLGVLALFLGAAIMGALLTGCAGDKATGLKEGGKATSAVGAALTAIPFPPAMIVGTVLGIVGTLMSAAGAALEKPKVLKIGAALGVAGLGGVGAGVAALPEKAALLAPAEPGAEPAAPTGTAVPQ